ncbi:hypothetical protein NJ7G_1589 [Natrinema sp. J7-2]|uniref:Uncharacterized protein n=1 Tax=Natrinema gari JCM 14663 TaxID=1230459 RepID=L9Z8L7_9EURY|nr:hypothetical protein NJ7G_1589 [Natrinema sp. J7-2]ELY82316.1 hypothetical protein C486_05005 [Natrinema gari JCM 14663]
MSTAPADTRSEKQDGGSGVGERRRTVDPWLIESHHSRRIRYHSD